MSTLSAASGVRVLGSAVRKASCSRRNVPVRDWDAQSEHRQCPMRARSQSRPCDAPVLAGRLWLKGPVLPRDAGPDPSRLGGIPKNTAFGRIASWPVADASQAQQARTPVSSPSAVGRAEMAGTLWRCYSMRARRPGSRRDHFRRLTRTRAGGARKRVPWTLGKGLSRKSRGVARLHSTFHLGPPHFHPSTRLSPIVAADSRRHRTVH